MSERRRRTAVRALNEINMTPLMDLTFLLLIVFMITAPVLEYAVDVSPPSLDAADMPEANVIIMLNGKGEIIFEKSVLDRNLLGNRLRHLAGENPLTQILIRADGGRPYKEVIEVMKIVRQAGLGQVMLVTEAEDIK